jgi:hypothetical protein
MKVLRVEQYKAPFVKEIDPGLESLQHEVDGWIQAVYPFEDPVAIICNEEGKLNGMELCRALRDENGEVNDVIAGPFLIVGCGEEDFDSLSEDMIGKYREIFSQPEVFIRTNSGLLVLPYVTDEFTFSSADEMER